MSQREGSVDAPIRYPLGQDKPEFWDADKVQQELERVFDICHGCRRCFNLCQSFPVMFDLIDESETMEVDGVDPADFNEVVDNCYQCDLCYQTKCPYVPPHEWNVDFPHLMLRAKAVNFKKGKSKLRDRVITSTDMMGGIVGKPGIAQSANFFNSLKPFRKVLDSVAGIHQDAPLPQYNSNTLEKRMKGRVPADVEVKPTDATTGNVALFGTCFGNFNHPELGEDFFRVFEHNGIPVTLVQNVQCCGMPKYDLGDLDTVEKLKDHNIPRLAELVDDGWDIVTLIPSCTLMFKQEIPLMYPQDEQVEKVKEAVFDPFEYLMLRHKAGLLDTDFKNPLGAIAYQVACHQRVQNMGMKTRDLFSLIPDTEVTPIERCSGHDGTYTLKSERHDGAMKILKPVVNRVKQAEAAWYTSDCAMAGHHIEHGMADGSHVTHPLTLLKNAYGL
ncbi:MAG: heterodisulfide reductase-related iron-sulfur binding cluster [Pseudomonadales bacterium]